MKKSSGFTLIELLVVIAIIAMLLSILLPALKKAKDQSQTVVCTSNLRQIGFAAGFYAQANKNFIPRGGSLGTWFKCFLPYLGQGNGITDYRGVKIYRCPSFPDKKQTVCYVASSWTFDSKTDPAGHEVTEPTRLSTFLRPMTTVYMADNEEGPWRPVIETESDPEIQRMDVWSVNHLPTSTNTTPTDLGNTRRVAKNRHRKGCNYLYIDWHAGYVETPKTPTEALWMWRDIK
jgi:prepilin-type N-terminal cleavage/methylation domain-containing protein/prepilin-type processing-associated H-X9-DG protein